MKSLVACGLEEGGEEEGWLTVLLHPKSGVFRLSDVLFIGCVFSLHRSLS